MKFDLCAGAASKDGRSVEAEPGAKLGLQGLHAATQTSELGLVSGPLSASAALVASIFGSRIQSATSADHRAFVKFQEQVQLKR